MHHLRRENAVIVVDRIEGTRAIIEIDGETFDIPALSLPNSATEGTVLAFQTCDKDVENLKKENEERLQRLHDSDPGDKIIDL
jgi:hypothetical protein